jgi:hypothetical protein
MTLSKTCQVFIPKVKIPPMTFTKTSQVFIPKVKIPPMTFTKTSQVFIPKVKIPPMTLTKSYQVFIPEVDIIEEFLKYIWRALYMCEHSFLKRRGILQVLFNSRMGVALLKGPHTYLYSLLIVGVRPSHSPFTL